MGMRKEGNGGMGEQGAEGVEEGGMGAREEMEGKVGTKGGEQASKGKEGGRDKPQKLTQTVRNRPSRRTRPSQK